MSVTLEKNLSRIRSVWMSFGLTQGSPVKMKDVNSSKTPEINPFQIITDIFPNSKMNNDTKKQITCDRDIDNSERSIACAILLRKQACIKLFPSQKQQHSCIPIHGTLLQNSLSSSTPLVE